MFAWARITVHAVDLYLMVTSLASVSSVLHPCVHTPSKVYSCSADGTVLAWNVSSLRVTSRLQLPGGGLSSIRLHDGCLWCCKSSASAPTRGPEPCSGGREPQDGLRPVCSASRVFSCLPPPVSAASGSPLWPCLCVSARRLGLTPRLPLGESVGLPLEAAAPPYVPARGVCQL